MTIQEQISSLEADHADLARLRALLDKYRRNGETDAECIERLAKAVRELAATETLLHDRERVLRGIPPCPQHGAGCVAHAVDWIAERIDFDAVRVTGTTRSSDNALLSVTVKDGEREVELVPRSVGVFAKPGTVLHDAAGRHLGVLRCRDADQWVVEVRESYVADVSMAPVRGVGGVPESKDGQMTAIPKDKAPDPLRHPFESGAWHRRNGHERAWVNLGYGGAGGHPYESTKWYKGWDAEDLRIRSTPTSMPPLRLGDILEDEHGNRLLITTEGPMLNVNYTIHPDGTFSLAPGVRRVGNIVEGK